MERSIRDGVILAIATGLLAFVGALGGSAYQNYLTSKQQTLEVKRSLYTKVLSELAILPLTSELETVFPTDLGVEAYDKLWEIPPEKLLGIQESLNSADLVAGTELSLRLSEFFSILETMRRGSVLNHVHVPKISEIVRAMQTQTGVVPSKSRTKLRKLYGEMKPLMKEEISP